MTKKEKVFVGISGGVDSSVAAFLLKKEGYEVHGIFVKTWSPEWLPCTWVDEKRDAMRVCAHLDIPFHFLDAEEAYKKGVADYMIAEYRAGRTPNPDVLCNRIIKFGVMWEYAKKHDAAYIATGHYAQINNGTIQRAVDPTKDQSYFLWMLTKEDVAHTLFPIGHLEKKEVRSIAKKAGLFTEEKKDSQGICFLGDVDMQAFLEHYIEQKNGPVVNEKGEIIGSHRGVWFYTLGERHGFSIQAATTNQKPYYVIGKNIKNNTLVVGNERKTSTKLHEEQKIILRDSSWNDSLSTVVTSNYRYHGASVPTRVVNNETVIIASHEPIALGQSLVCFSEEGRLIGGGIIDAIE